MAAQVQSLMGELRSHKPHSVGGKKHISLFIYLFNIYIYIFKIYIYVGFLWGFLPSPVHPFPPEIAKPFSVTLTFLTHSWEWGDVTCPEKILSSGSKDGSLPASRLFSPLPACGWAQPGQGYMAGSLHVPKQGLKPFFQRQGGSKRPLKWGEVGSDTNRGKKKQTLVWWESFQAFFFCVFQVCH